MIYWIFTSAAESDLLALDELTKSVPGFELVKWIDGGVGLARADCSFDAIAERIKTHLCAYTRHVCPVDMEVPGELSEILSAASKLASRLNPAQSFSVQTRVFNDKTSPFDVNQAVSSSLTLLNPVSLNVKNPDQIVSIVLDGSGTKRAYIGLSESKFNLSSWAGGKRRFARESDQLSRAEFKLLEAFEAFEIHLPETGLALDLGAAPGGWTRVLRNQGFNVVAVDPAALDPALAKDPGVTHRRETTQTFLPTDLRFDVITNDMRMDARESARLMNEVAHCLLPDGVAIMTLKLPESGPGKYVRQALGILETTYSTVGLRQLFHNRSEVTVVLKSKE